MFKNIAKRIQTLAIILAVFFLVAFLALAVFFLYSMLQTEDETLRSAGLQGVIISVVLAAITPLLSWLIYGFGTLIQCAERQAETSRETRDLVRQALAEGALSDDLARKLGPVIAKAIPAAPATGYAPQQIAQPLAARPVTPPTPKAAPAPKAAPVKPTEPAEAAPVKPAPKAPAKAAEAPAVQKATTATTEKATTPVATPTDLPSTVQPLKPLGGSNKTY